MQSAARLEIITSAAARTAVQEVLDEQNAPGYAVYHHVTGRGTHARHYDDDPAGEGANVCLVVICPATHAEQIAAAVEPLLKRYGGICTATETRLAAGDAGF
jgi:hypothetical protein